MSTSLDLPRPPSLPLSGKQNKIARMPQQLTINLPELYPLQFEAVYPSPDKDGDIPRIRLVEATTKAGKTTAALYFLIREAYDAERGGEHKKFLWCSPVFSQSKIAYERLKAGLGPEGYRKANDTAQVIELVNGSILDFRTGDSSDHLMGEEYQLAIIDEASRFREQSFFSIMSTLTTTGGACLMIGNVTSRNWFWRLCRRAELGEKNLSYVKITYEDAIEGGVMNLEDVKLAESLLPEHIFKSLYLAEVSEEGTNPFNEEAIERNIVESLSPKDPIVWGVDLGSAVDYTCAVGLDEDGVVCQFHYFQKPWTDTAQFIQIECLEQFPQSLLTVDSTGVGSPLLAHLTEHSPGRVEGYIFTGPSKQQLCEGLMVRLARNEIQYPEGKIPQELRGFSYTTTPLGNIKYEAAGSGHDDAVMALALACYKLKSSRHGLGVW